MPKLHEQYRQLCRQAGLREEPTIVWAPRDPRARASVFAGIGSIQLELGGGFPAFLGRNEGAAFAVLRHELSHVKNADVARTYLTQAMWTAFLFVIVSPFTIILILHSADGMPVVQLAWRFAVLTIAVWGIRNSILRSREYEADATAAEAGPAVREQLLVLLGAAATARKRNWRHMIVHPSPGRRRTYLTNTAELVASPATAFALTCCAALSAAPVAAALYDVHVAGSTLNTQYIASFLLGGAAAVGLVTEAARIGLRTPVQAPFRPVLGLALAAGLGMLAGQVTTLPSGIGQGPVILPRSSFEWLTRALVIVLTLATVLWSYELASVRRYSRPGWVPWRSVPAAGSALMLGTLFAYITASDAFAAHILRNEFSRELFHGVGGLPVLGSYYAQLPSTVALSVIVTGISAHAVLTRPKDAGVGRALAGLVACAAVGMFAIALPLLRHWTLDSSNGIGSGLRWASAALTFGVLLVALTAIVASAANRSTPLCAGICFGVVAGLGMCVAFLVINAADGGSIRASWAVERLSVALGTSLLVCMPVSAIAWCLITRKPQPQASANPAQSDRPRTTTIAALGTLLIVAAGCVGVRVWPVHFAPTHQIRLDAAPQSDPIGWAPVTGMANRRFSGDQAESATGTEEVLALVGTSGLEGGALRRWHSTDGRATARTGYLVFADPAWALLAPSTLEAACAGQLTPLDHLRTAGSSGARCVNWAHKLDAWAARPSGKYVLWASCRSTDLTACDAADVDRLLAWEWNTVSASP
jgi:hypothetical protein